MKILVTGGAGYIGSLLLPKLLERDHEVILYDNFAFGIKPILNFAAHEKLSIEEGDIRDEKRIIGIMKKADLIIHLAAIVGYPACAADPLLARTVNVDGSRNITKNLSASQRSIFASTGSTYGKVVGVCDETTPIAPLTLYGSSKAEAETLFLDQGGIGLRFATVFGISPRLRLDLLVNDFVHQAIHNKQIVLFEGGFKRTFLHVLDAVHSITFAIDHYDQMKGEAFNVGDETMNYTKQDIAHLIKEKIDYYLHEAAIGQDMDQRDYEVSYKKIKNLGYAIQTDIHHGIDKLIKVLNHIHISNEWRNA